MVTPKGRPKGYRNSFPPSANGECSARRHGFRYRLTRRLGRQVRGSESVSMLGRCKLPQLILLVLP